MNNFFFVSLLHCITFGYIFSKLVFNLWNLSINLLVFLILQLHIFATDIRLVISHCVLFYFVKCMNRLLRERERENNTISSQYTIVQCLLSICVWWNLMNLWNAKCCLNLSQCSWIYNRDWFIIVSKYVKFYHCQVHLWFDLM